MSGNIARSVAVSALVSSLFVLGCSSSGDGDGGVAAPTVPAGATVITGTNAKDVIQQAIAGGSTIIDALPVGVNAAGNLTAWDILDIAVDKTRNAEATSVLSTPAGVAVDIPCTGGGSITGDVTETETSESGTVTFNQCIELGIEINGTITYSATLDASGNWTLNLSGNLSGAESVVIVTLSQLVFNANGNDNTGEVSINRYQFALENSVGGGFATMLESPILENELQSCPDSPRSGVILVLGADNTRARGTINTGGTVTVEFDDGSGTFTEVTEPPPGSPYPCTDFFT